MGRRRAKQKKIATKKVVKLGIVFRCLQCNHEDAVDCKMDKAAKIGRLTCRVCGVTYQMKVNCTSVKPTSCHCSSFHVSLSLSPFLSLFPSSHFFIIKFPLTVYFFNFFVFFWDLPYLLFPSTQIQTNSNKSNLSLSTIADLMEPIDVYCSWIDATKAMNEEDAAGGRRGGGGGGSASSSSGARQGGGYDDDDDSDVEEAVNPVEVAKRKQAEQESRDQQQDKDADDLFGSDSDSD